MDGLAGVWKEIVLLKQINRKKIFLITVIHMVQIFMVVGLQVLQNLTHYRPMLMRYVYTQKNVFAEWVWTQPLLIIYSLCLLTVIFIYRKRILKNRKPLNWLIVIETFIGGLMIVFTLIAVNTSYFFHYLTYYYWIIGSLLLLMLQGAIINRLIKDQ